MNNLALLYAEDDRETREDTLYFLDGCCPIIHTAVNGEEALKIYNEFKIDLILLDINMPKINGMDILRKIRQKDNKTKIIFISAHSDSQNLISAINLGISAYIVKPYNPKELKEVITRIADKKFEKDIVDDNVVVSHTDKNGVIIDVSSAFCKLSRYPIEELMGKTHKIISHEDTPADIHKDMWNTISSGKKWIGEVKNKSKDLSEYWVLSTITPLFGLNNSITGYISVQNDITQKKEMEYLSRTDALTGLFNRGYFNKIIEKEISSSKRYNTYFNFLMIDIDYFKQYNDTYGHQAGDNVLKEVSCVLSNYSKRDRDFVFRLGGEEFGILTTGIDDIKIKKLANMIIDDIINLNILHENSCVADVLTVSIGLYMAKGSDILDKETIYFETDKALYKSKNGGRNMLSIVGREELK